MSKKAGAPQGLVDLDKTVDLLMDFMRIEGPSGQETGVAEKIISLVRKAGLKASAIRRDTAHRKSPLGGQVGNLIVKLPGTARRPRRLFSAHMDTVGVCLGCKPVRKGRRIVSGDPATGLGGDDRAGTTAILTALLTILKHKLPHPPLTFIWTVQEEVGLQGAHYVDIARLGPCKMGFNFDGSDSIVIGATGGYVMDVEITGIASHAGCHPERGVSAVLIAAIAIADLESKGWHGAVRKGRNKGTSNVGIVQAGPATNVVSPRALVRAEARSHDPAFRKRILKAYRDAFACAAKAVANDAGRHGKVSFSHRLNYESFSLSKVDPVVLAAIEASRQIGTSAELEIVDGGLDANWFNVHGIPTVTLGSGDGKAHTTGEYVDVSRFGLGCELAIKLATDVG